MTKAENPQRSREQIEAEIASLVVEHYQVAHQRKPFVPGKTKVAYAGRVYDSEEMKTGVESVLQYWLTAGPFARRFEESMKGFFGSNSALLVNSGSSANLLMIATLCSPQVKNHLVPGDEVITPAVTFPTTLTPIVQHGLVPVFVDCQPGEYDIDVTQIEAAIGPRTRCIFVPHTVGIPCHMDAIMEIAKRHDLWVLEDGCDALGATWNGRLVGTFGSMSGVALWL
jgi:CDP-6-deoxy-D-xylo-4-hexulose-3-dehydrase